MVLLPSSFVAPLTILLPSTSANFAPRECNAKPCRRPRLASRHSGRLTPHCAWQQQLLPDDSSALKLRQLHTAPSTLITTLTPHTVTAHHLHAVDTTSDRAIALPFVSSHERNVLLDTLSLTHFLPPQTAVPPASAATITTSLPASLRAFLGLDVPACNVLAAHIMRDGRVNRAVVLRRTLISCGVKCLACVLREAPGMGRSLPLEATMFVTWMDDQRHVMEVQLSPAIAVAVAAVCETPCYVKRSLIHAAGVCTRGVVDQQVPLESPSQQEAQRSEPRSEPSELLAHDVLNMSQQLLLLTVRRCHIAASSDDSREQLLKRLLPHMCEVQRREVAIALAAEQGRYDLAAELQRNRSQRGELYARMRDMERMGKLSEAVNMAERLRELAADKQDVSLEPGSYDSYLDRDEWYRPTR